MAEAYRPPPPNNTFNFTAEQTVSLVRNVVIQIAQPQLCTTNLPEKQVQAEFDLSKQIAETAKKCLGVNIEGKDVFESTLVEKKKAPLKASTVLNKITPTPVATSSNSTKSTKNPSLGSQRISSSKLLPQQNKTTSTKPPPRPSPTRNKPSN